MSFGGRHAAQKLRHPPRGMPGLVGPLPRHPCSG